MVSKVINNGFKPGLSRKDIQLLDVVLVEWDDAEDEVVLVTCVEKRQHNYKGYCSYEGLVQHKSTRFFQSDQIVRKLGTVDLNSFVAQPEPTIASTI